MADQSRGGVKYIIWGVLGIIAILVAAKQLGFTPTKIITPAVSVELGGIAPKESNPKEYGSRSDTPQLEARVRELEAQLASSTSQTAAPSPKPTQQGYQPEDEVPNLTGTWRADFMEMRITQYGTSVLTQVSVYGVLLSVGQGALAGRNLNISYVNNLAMQGTLNATVSPDGRRLDVIDYGKGYPQQIVFYRYP